MPGKDIRCSRKACTATSLAALRTTGWLGPAARASRARRRQGKRAKSGPEGQRADLGQIQAFQINAQSVRIAEAIADVVRPACPDGPAAIHRCIHQGMDDGLRMHDHVDLVWGRSVQMHGLDDLQAFVHHGCRIDGNFLPHGPIGVLQGPGRSRGLDSRQGFGPNGPPDAVRIRRETCAPP